MPDGGRVLVVEDDEAIARVLVEALELDDYEVRSASDGRAALELLAAWPADAILLDLMMPVMDGWGFREEQRRNPAISDIPVVVVSASFHLDARSSEMAPAAVVHKPFDLDRLLELVRRIVDARP